jgi:hypothetical protein
VSWGQAAQYEAELDIPNPYVSGRDSRDPAQQNDQIVYWQAWLDVRYALHELVQQGFLVATVQGVNPALPGNIWTCGAPKVALGQPGQTVAEAEFPTVPLIGGEYRWSIGESAQKSARLELYDADLFMRKADLTVLGERVRRCVEEGLACYRADLLLVAANMFGAASEAAWHPLSETMRTQGLAAPSSRELDQVNPSIARLQQHALQDLREMGTAAAFEQRFGFAHSALDSVQEVARFWRDLRNYGMHWLARSLRRRSARRALPWRLWARAGTWDASRRSCAARKTTPDADGQASLKLPQRRRPIFLGGPKSLPMSFHQLDRARSTSWRH